jgi:cytidine deaminase
MADAKPNKGTAVSFDKLPKRDQELLRKASAMVHRAYAPYSGFGVGAALRTTSGALFAGANMENAAYAVTLCAETSALQQSLAAGDFKVESIAVVGGPLDGTGGREIVTPCGRCRQLIFEAAQVSGKDVRVLSANADMSKVLVLPISALLPHGFGPKNLGRT